MSQPFPREDSTPWYRQFWPWFLILLPASVVVAGLTTVVIATRHADDLVIDDYYKDGLAINRQLEKQQRAEQLGISADVQFDNKTATVVFEGPVHTERVRLLLSHPLEAERDFEALLQSAGNKTYRGVLQQPVAANWHWRLEPADSDEWRLDGSVVSSDLDNGPGN